MGNSYLYFKRFSDFEVVPYENCFKKKKNDSDTCKKCSNTSSVLRRMQAIANSIGNRKRRYTPEILKLHRILRKMQSALGFTTNSPKKPTRTTRNTHQETTTDKKGK